MTTWTDYFERFLEKDPLATGRLVNLVENTEDTLERRELLRACARQGKTAYVIGITGVPGAGKSTLVDGLGCWLADRGHRVGVLCVDPSSPFRGGALLGDRIRFTNLSKRRDCFIRSMATRGHLGGMAAAAGEVLQLLEAGGYDVLLVETVGVGQTEVEIVGLADTVVLVTVPGLGDQIQVAKAGIMEIGHVFVVNKSDRPDADQALKALRIDLELYRKGDWMPPVVPTVASRGEGIADLGERLIERYDHLVRTGQLESLHAARRAQGFGKLMEKTFRRLVAELLETDAHGRKIREGVETGELDLYDASASLWSRLAESLASGEPASAARSPAPAAGRTAARPKGRVERVSARRARTPAERPVREQREGER